MNATSVLFGVRIDALTMDQAVERCMRAVRDREPLEIGVVNAAKLVGMRRDPRLAICGLNDGFYGDWVQVEGTAEIIELPEAMDLLVEYYRRASGEHPDWDDYRAAMERDQRVIVRLTIERAGLSREG